MPQQHFTPRERAPGTHCIGGWVGPRPVWMQRFEEKSCASVGDWNPVDKSVVRHYTDWATRLSLATWWPLEFDGDEDNLKLSVPTETLL
jgi:hypothetical protein